MEQGYTGRPHARLIGCEGDHRPDEPCEFERLQATRNEILVLSQDIRDAVARLLSAQRELENVAQGKYPIDSRDSAMYFVREATKTIQPMEDRIGNLYIGDRG